MTMPTSTNYFWIGINDLVTEGTFQYATGGDLGTKYLFFFSARSLKTREKYISFAQLVLLNLYIL